MSTTGLCTRCNKPLGKVAKKVDGKLYHQDCWLEMHREQDPINKLRADRDRLLAVVRKGLRYMACPHIIPADDCERCQLNLEAKEAIRLAEKEE